jgi:hypothetical protein
MSEDNAAHYFEHSDSFHVALDLTGGRRGLQALSVALTRWIAHLLAVEVTIEPLTEMQEVNFSWYVGLDAEATQIGDTLWNGGDLDEATQGRVVGLYRMISRDPAVAVEPNDGEPVYLILAMGRDKVLRMKPQNLVTGLPTRHLGAMT